MNFDYTDTIGLEFPHNDPIVISVKIGGKLVKRLLVDHGSSINLITEDVFNGFGGRREDIIRVARPLSRLGAEVVHPMGVVELEIELGGLDRDSERTCFLPGPTRSER